MCFVALNPAAQQKISFFSIVEMRHYNRYFTIFVKPNAICSNTFFVYYAGFLISKCFFNHKI